MGHLHGPRVNGVIHIDQRVKFMKEIQSGLLYPWSEAWYVDQDDGNDSYDGKSPSSSKLTLLAAEAAMAIGDRIYLKPGSTDHDIAEGVVFDLNDISVIGVSPNKFQSHVELSQPNETPFSPMFTFSGRGGYFANLTIEHGSKLSSGVGYATDLTAALISGRYNMFDNVYFYTPLYAEQDVASTYKGVSVTGHGNYFYQCKFGSDGLDRDQINYNLVVAGVGNIFDECIFQMKNDGTAPFFVYINNAVRDMKYVLFRRCTFYAHDENHVAAVAEAFKTDAAGGNTVAVILEDCNFVNVTKVSSAADDAVIFKHTVGDTAATNATGIAVKGVGN